MMTVELGRHPVVPFGRRLKDRRATVRWRHAFEMRASVRSPARRQVPVWVPMYERRYGPSQQAERFDRRR
jgi:hypothetical protein